MTPRTLITAAALLALSGWGLVSRVEASIIALDEGFAQEAVGENLGRVIPGLIDADGSFPLPNVLVARLQTEESSNEGMGSGIVNSTNVSFPLAISSAVVYAWPNTFSTKFFAGTEPKWIPPSPDQIRRPPCNLGR